MKGNPDVTGNTQVAMVIVPTQAINSFPRTCVTIPDRDNLFRDPVAIFVAIAFTDHAFNYASSVENFFAINSPYGQDSLKFGWRDEVVDVPAFWVVESSGDNIDLGDAIQCTTG